MPTATLIRRRPSATGPRRPAAADPATLRRLVEYAVRAPSAHDAQPWLFRIRGDALDLRVDRTVSGPDPDDRGHIIDCGAALGFLRVAIRALGRTAHVQRFPDAGEPDLLATIRLGEPCDATLDEVTLFAAIRRRPHQRHFAERAVSGRVLATLADTVRMEGAWLRVLSEPADRAAVAGEACMAPALLVLGTDDDTPAGWLRCGEALGLLLLRACVHGVSVSFIHPPVEVRALRMEPGRLPGGSGQPQLVLGIGYGSGIPCIAGEDEALTD